MDAVLNLTWNETWFVAFLFLLVWVVSYLPRLGNVIGDFLFGYRGGRGKGAASGAKRESGPEGGSAP